MKIIDNTRKVNFSYYITQEFEAGIVLSGGEVKSLRQRKVSISDSYVIEKNMELWLNNIHISAYSNLNNTFYDPKKPRKLLLHKKQIYKIAGQLKTSGVTVVPLSLYFNSKGFIKVNIAIVKGKKLYDKRETIKKRDWNREKSRIMKT